jgi:trans-AT polyketide synthase/acyltransferase/oxidoreductase domain-containing protein
VSNGLPVIGTWPGHGGVAHFTPASLPAAIAAFRSPAFIVRDGPAGVAGVGVGGTLQVEYAATGYPCLGVLSPLYPEWLGDRSFLEMHGLRFPYVTGAMARGIASESLVIEMARAGMLGFFGAGGLSPARVEQALATLTESLGDRLPWGCNLIHSPQEPALESIIVGLLLRYQVRRVEASAFMSLTPAVVRYAFSGVTRDATGQIQRANHVFAKISRPEVAQHFMAPPPVAMLDALVQAGELTATEAALARLLPVAEDITVESDSGGHTDNRPLGSLFPTIASCATRSRPRAGTPPRSASERPVALALRNRWRPPLPWAPPIVLTGSVNRGCVEAGVSADVKAMSWRWPNWPT